MKKATCVALPVFVAIACQFHVHAPEMYMDEPFHVPQTQKYCSGQLLDWDPKITTFPGLYVLGTAYALLLEALGSICLPEDWKPLVEGCNATLLRSTNIALGLVCLWLLYSIYQVLHPSVSPKHVTEMALMLTLFPLHFFFHFLYYTDIGSLTFVLASYFASLKQSHKASAMMGAVAVLFRQTNAVWVVFIIGMAVLERCFKLSSRQQLAQKLPAQLMYTIQRAWNLKWQLLSDLWALILVPFLFAAFVIWNGGIVLGDKAAHAPVKHFMQPLYFALFAAGAVGPYHFDPHRLLQAARLVKTHLQKRPLVASIMLLGSAGSMAYVVHNFTLVHPYLLADNRHYTFYLWKNVFARYPAARYMLIPLYVYSSWSIWDSITRQQSKLCGLLFVMCTIVTLVPAWLIEFRYFTIPFVLMVLHMQPLTSPQQRVTMIAYIVANVTTIYTFLYRPFRWPDHSVARFIW